MRLLREQLLHTRLYLRHRLLQPRHLGVLLHLLATVSVQLFQGAQFTCFTSALQVQQHDKSDEEPPACLVYASPPTRRRGAGGA